MVRSKKSITVSVDAKVVKKIDGIVEAESKSREFGKVRRSDVVEKLLREALLKRGVALE